jgi:hypothetical protein
MEARAATTLAGGAAARGATSRPVAAARRHGGRVALFRCRARWLYIKPREEARAGRRKMGASDGEASRAARWPRTELGAGAWRG